MNEELKNNFKNWNNTSNLLIKRKKEYCKTINEFRSKEFDILTTTDFKSLYGQNNDKIRKEHIKRELEDLYAKKESLSLEIEILEMDLEYIKTLTKAKIKFGEN